MDIFLYIGPGIALGGIILTIIILLLVIVSIVFRLIYFLKNKK
jgi:hypothetical protein